MVLWIYVRSQDQERNGTDDSEDLVCPQFPGEKSLSE